MYQSILKGGIAGGIIVFVWSAISWMALPWHMMTFSSFKNEADVAQVITANAPHSGIYLMPMMEAPAKSQLPQVFASIRLEGMASMTVGMITGLIINIIAAFFVAWLLTKAQGLTYLGRVKFIFIFAIAVAILANLPYWNWFAFSTSYTLVEMADVIIGWVLASLVMAKLV